MKQILLTLILGLLFNVANAVILKTNCPDYNPSTHTIGTHLGFLRVNLELEFEDVEPLIAYYYEVDFKSNLGNVDGIKVSDFSVVDVYGNRSFSINIPVTKFALNTQFIFFAQIRDSSDIIYQTVEVNTYINNSNMINFGFKLSNTNPSAGKNILEGIGGNQIFSPVNFKVFPNPFIDEFTVKSYGVQSESINIELFDLNGVLYYSNTHAGEEIFYEKTNDINLPKGVYFCRLSSANFEKNIRLIKM